MNAARVSPNSGDADRVCCSQLVITKSVGPSSHGSSPLHIALFVHRIDTLI